MSAARTAQKWATMKLDKILEEASELCSTNGTLFAEIFSTLFTTDNDKLCLKLLTRLLSEPTLPETGQTFLFDFIAVELTDLSSSPFHDQFLVYVIEFTVEALDDSNPTVLPDPKRLCLLKPLLERVSSSNVEVKFMDAYLTTSQLGTRVMTHIIVESSWDCSLYFIHVIMLLNELSVPVVDVDMVPVWLTNLFDRFQEFYRQSPSEVPAVFYQLCKLCCERNLLEFLLYQINKVMMSNECVNENERTRASSSSCDENQQHLVLLMQCESNCVTTFLELFRLVPQLSQHLIKFLQKNLPASSHVHLSRFFFTLCIYCLAPGSASFTGASAKESIEDLLFKQLVTLTECEMMSGHVTHYSQQLPPLKTVRHYVIQCISACSQNAASSSVLEGLVAFGFALVDRFGPLTLMTKAAANQRYRPAREPLTVRQPLCQLGSDILTTMCQKFDICRSTLIKETISNLFVKAANRGNLVQPYAQLLAKLIRIAPVTVFENLDGLYSWFEYLPLLPESVASHLFHGLRPVMKLSHTLKEELLPVLRKAHRSNRISARETAASGCLVLLRNTRMTSSGSDRSSARTIPCSISLSQMPSSFGSQGIDSNSESNNALSLELISILRRSLSQNYSVKALLYREFPDVITQNEGWSCAVMELLYQHFIFVTNYSKEGLGKVMELNLAEHHSVDEDGQLNEPIGLLINTMGECFHIINTRLAARSVNEIENGDDALIMACRNSSKLLNEIVSSYVTADFPGSSSENSVPNTDWKTTEGQKGLNQLRARSLILQALIQFRFRQLVVLCQDSAASTLDTECVNSNISDLQELFTKLVSVSTFLKDSKNSPSRSGTNLTCLFTLESMTSLISRLVLPGNRCEIDVQLFETFQDLHGVKTLILQYVKMEAQVFYDFNTVEFAKCAYTVTEQEKCAELRGDMAALLWSGVCKQLEGSPTENTTATRGTRNAMDSFLDTVIHIIRSLKARNPNSLAQIIQKLVNLDSSLDHSNTSTSAQSNRRSNFRSSSVFYQLFEKITSLINRMCQGDLSNGSPSPRQTIQNLFRFLALAIEMLFYHHSGSRTASGFGQLHSLSEGDFGNGSTRKSGGMTSSWELKECCQSLCKLCLDLSCLDVISSRLLLSIVFNFCSRIQTCNFVTKIAAQIFYQLGDYSEPMETETANRAPAVVRIVNRENAEMLACEVNAFLSQWLNHTQNLSKTYNRILCTMTKDTLNCQLSTWVEKTETKLCQEFVAITHTLIKLLNCSFSRESSFCATINNCHHYYTSLNLLFKCIVYKVQINFSVMSGPIMTSDLETVMKNSQAPMKDGLHNALEHAVACLWRATEIDGDNKKEKKKRKHNQLQPSSSDDILADVTAQHNEGHVIDDVSPADNHDVNGASNDVEGYMSSNQGNEKGKVQIGKETKNIPELIFAMEQSEKSIFHICKLLKMDSSPFVSSVNLRNFRVRDETSITISDNLQSNSTETNTTATMHFDHVATSTQRPVPLSRRPGSV